MSSEIRVLVVDDEPSIRNSLVEFLEDFEFNVSSADSAEEALDLIACFPFDIAIVDIRLPRLDGDSLIMQAHRLRPTMRFLIHTGSVEYKLGEDLCRIGILPEHVFLKPQMDLMVFRDAMIELMNSQSGYDPSGDRVDDHDDRSNR
ncbi:Response regulator receiver domain protein (CheY-like) [Desulfosarcina cetonica]|uniref:response regulator n=1 Tax=Desulfosarcina cetonica TaxID=90730 RepID=UPI0006D09522|nr:response regulator [Desulfosarcina cetonica]VTR66571.1 Response regulator receiver domain protein (CheY-like) [Desulfosarcina cetonica]